ncbi:MAG TPA: hypothetical protein VGF59_04920, partial [Bryobacteraceae bacterium]
MSAVFLRLPISTMLRFRFLLTLLLAARVYAGWTPLGPFGGPAAFVVADPNSPKTFVAGTQNALLFQTRDGGETWTGLPFPGQFRATLNVLIVDPETPGVYIAGLSSELPQYAGALRSTDEGKSWRQIPGL